MKGKPGRKKKEVENAEVKVQDDVQEEVKCGPPHLSRCQCKDPLGPGQAYFEDGQTGTVIIGDETRGEVLFKYIENGKEMSRKINKRR